MSPNDSEKNLALTHRNLLFPDGRDPRLIIAMATLCGVLVWTLPPLFLALPVLASIMGCIVVQKRISLTLVKAGCIMALAWGVGKFIADTLLLNMGMEQRLVEAALLTTRLASSVALGLILSAATSPLGLALAVAWALRPILGSRHWKPALTLMVMITWLPRCHDVLSETWAMLQRRAPKMPLHQKLAFLGKAVLHRLEQESLYRSIALVLRNLTTSTAWNWPAATSSTSKDTYV